MKFLILIEDASRNITGHLKRLDIPDISRRDIWDNLDKELKDKIIEAGEKSLDKEWPLILITDYMEFQEIKRNRLVFFLNHAHQ